MPDVFNAPQMRIMLDLQSAMNRKVDPDWIEAAYPYLRAVVVEAAEAIEHHGWKWWKKQSMDLPQLQMEIVDIWHFLLSEILLRHDGDIESSLEYIENNLNIGTHQPLGVDGQQIALNEQDLLTKFELLTATAALRRIDLAIFSTLLADCQMSWEILFRQYVGKNVLNFFRQDHGYKEGTYIKVWSDGREDNEHLVEIMQTIDANADNVADLFYQGLKKRYPTT